jgi:ferrous iron transport protein A
MASPPLRAPAVPLHTLPIGERARVLEVPASGVAALEAEGVTPGVLLEMETRQPLGGPVVVRAGRARLALALPIARGILVEPVARDAPIS